MQNDPEAARELEALGFRALPVTVAGTRAVLGFDARALKEALGIESEAPRDLSAHELLQKYRLLYEGAKRAVLQIPNDELDWATPQKERRGQTLRQLCFHLFDRPDVCIEAARTGQYTYEMCHEYEHLANNYRTTRELVDFADLAMSRLEDFMTNEAPLLERMVETYFGPKKAGELMNMALAGLALRIKQTYYFQRAIGIEPKNPLTEEQFRGINVPKDIFGQN